MIESRLGGAVAALLCAATVSAAATVRIRVVDDATGTTVPARVSLWRGATPVVPSGFPAYRAEDEHHFLVRGEFSLDLHPATYRMNVERGLEWLPGTLEFTVPFEGTLAVRLRRWADMNREGWYAADMHVHRDPSDVPLVMQAEDLNFVPTITTHVWSTEVSRRGKPPDEFPVVVEPGRIFTGNAQEVERILGGPGAVILLGRDLPLPFDGYELFPPNAAYARRVHEAGGFVEGDKLFWLDTAVNAVLGHVDFVELNCNHFLPRKVDTDLVPWSHWPVELGYRGPRGFALWMMDLYYRLLSSGTELALSAGTANGVKAGPVGYNRVYVKPAEAFGYESFMRALKQGRSFTTNGPLLDLEVDGVRGPGDRIVSASGGERRFRGRARSRNALERLQLVVNGRVVAEREAPAGARELTLEKAVRVDRSAWAVLRAFERSDDREPWRPAGHGFAHTSPVYLVVRGRPAVVPDSARQLLEQIERLIAHTRTLDGFRSESDRQQTLAVYQEARDVVAGRLSAGP